MLEKRRDNPPYYISAYALACRKGFKGTEEEWLESLTAYGEAVKQGFEGTKEKWIASLKGEQGKTGKSAYEYAVEGGFQGNEELFREQQANSGKSAYEYAVEGGYTGTVQEFYEKLAKEYLPKDGGSMAGELAMSGNRVTGLGAPQEDSDAARKQDVDAVGTLAAEGKTLAEKALPKAGGAMTGAIDMGGNPVTGLGTPTGSGDAASKSYVDGKHVVKTATITTTWKGSAAPYTQSVTVSGILSTDYPHITPVYSTTNSTAIAQKKAWANVSKAVAESGKITFTCFEEKPTTAIPIQIEVMR